MTVLKFYFLFFFCFLSWVVKAQEITSEAVRAKFTEYGTLVKDGRLKEAVNCLTILLQSGVELTTKDRLGINNNLGIQNKNLGQFDVALKYYGAAESIFLDNNFTDISLLVRIYGNKANIYSIKGDNNKALEYCEKALRTASESNTLSKNKQFSSSLYLNAGNAYFQVNDFSKALSAIKTSIYLKEKYNLSGKGNGYLSLAKTYAKMDNHRLADNYFKISIKEFEGEKKSFSTDMVNIYLQYGHFLISINENSKAFIPIRKALDINLKIVDDEKQNTSNCYQLMGDYYRIIKDYPNALIYYQKTLISGSKDFSDLRIEANPSMADIGLDLWQLRVLRHKADVLASLAKDETDQKKRINFLSASLNTSSLAIELTNTIRDDYQNEETRLLFNEKQKNVFVSALESALALYQLTGEKKYLELAYQTTQQSKANELKYEIAKNRSFSSSEIPDSLRNKEKELQRDIAAFMALVREELAKPVPDTVKTAYWKDQQFDLNRRLEKTIESIDQNYPRFTDKLKKGSIIPLETIQSNLKPDESLVEYLMSERDNKENRKLYEFVITKKDLTCHIEVIDSVTSKSLSCLKKQLTNQFSGNATMDGYNQLNQLLFESYNLLIQPIEKHFSGKRLIIIPDDEISYLPFDAFLTNWVQKKKINYAELNYLIRDYSISYGYSANTLWNSESKTKNFPKVIGFAPDYSKLSADDNVEYKSLKANSLEIKSILRNFRGSIFEADQATVSSFRAVVNSGAILHLAMHAELDTTQAGSSSLVFTPGSDKKISYRLYNYEIGQMSVNSPMVVLSACNTGNGKLYGAEGLMSLARNFVLAGVPAVVETLWPVEDVAGSKIMGSFYQYLSQGMPKSSALRLAKLDYINNSSPTFVNPRFWAAYSLRGDVSAVKTIWWKEKMVIIGGIITILMLIALIIYRLRFLRMS